MNAPAPRRLVALLAVAGALSAALPAWSATAPLTNVWMAAV